MNKSDSNSDSEYHHSVRHSVIYIVINHRLRGFAVPFVCYAFGIYHSMYQGTHLVCEQSFAGRFAPREVQSISRKGPRVPDKNSAVGPTNAVLGW